jgi:predicted phage terminase large subunit-like protein
MRSAFGMLSKVTGDRGDCLIVDDPNDVDEVKSEVKRRAVNERWSDAIENRVSNLQTSFRIGIMQRCHTEDWSGHVLKSGNWEHLCIPQEFEEPRSPTAIGWLDPRTEPGELLDPKRSPAEVIAKEKAKGAYYYAGQHQQRPVPKEGGVIQGAWIRKRDRLPDRIDRWILSVDAKFKKTKSGSFAVVQAWAQSGADLFIFDQWRERLGFVQTKNAILTMRERWGSELGSESATLIEDKASGPAIIDELSSIPGIIPIQPDGSKESRLEAASGYYESGNVYVVEETWSKSEHSTPQIWIDELTSFPFASTDDQCDGASQAIRYLQRKPLSYTSAFTSQES